MAEFAYAPPGAPFAYARPQGQQRGWDFEAPQTTDQSGERMGDAWMERRANTEDLGGQLAGNRILGNDRLRDYSDPRGNQSDRSMEIDPRALRQRTQPSRGST